MFQTTHPAALDPVPIVTRSRMSLSFHKPYQYLIDLGLSEPDAFEQCSQAICEAEKTLRTHLGGEQNILSDEQISRTAISSLSERAISGELTGIRQSSPATKTPAHLQMHPAEPLCPVGLFRRRTYTAVIKRLILAE